jgi:signal transduction histidine kinase
VEVRRAANGQATIEVEDQGPGVPAGERESIFEPFQRASSVTPDSRGTGLGLAIVRQVARAHGGDVTCEPGARGARFVVVLPSAG